METQGKIDTILEEISEKLHQLDDDPERKQKVTALVQKILLEFTV